MTVWCNLLTVLTSVWQKRISVMCVKNVYLYVPCISQNVKHVSKPQSNVFTTTSYLNTFQVWLCPFLRHINTYTGVNKMHFNTIHTELNILNNMWLHSSRTDDHITTADTSNANTEKMHCYLLATRCLSLTSDLSNQMWGEDLTMARCTIPINPPCTWPTWETGSTQVQHPHLLTETHTETNRFVLP